MNEWEVEGVMKREGLFMNLGCFCLECYFVRNIDWGLNGRKKGKKEKQSIRYLFHRVSFVSGVVQLMFSPHVVLLNRYVPTEPTYSITPSP